ncbi:DUF6122 family protein [Cloacibacterium rupense]|nr:DUF6122 family protein [Cloacibacterium rupense]
MEIAKISVHYFLHLVFPVFIALFFFRQNWKKAYLIMLCTMLVDVDHLLATPMFDSHRCSIGFHPLHSYYAIVVYALGSIFLKGDYRIISVGLLFHMLTDFQDYYCWN